MLYYTKNMFQLNNKITTNDMNTVFTLRRAYSFRMLREMM